MLNKWEEILSKDLIDSWGRQVCRNLKSFNLFISHTFHILAAVPSAQIILIMIDRYYYDPCFADETNLVRWQSQDNAFSQSSSDLLSNWLTVFKQGWCTININIAAVSVVSGVKRSPAGRLA